MLNTIAKREDIQQNISEYLDMMENGQEIIMVKNGQEVGRFLPRGKVVSLAAERVKGILSRNIDVDKARDEALREKYGLVN